MDWLSGGTGQTLGNVFQWHIFEKVSSKVIPVFGVVSMVLSSVTGGVVDPRVTGVGSMVSSVAHIKQSHFIFLLCETRVSACLCVCVCVCAFVTWLKGDLAEHHPDVCKVKATADGFGRAAIKRHSDVAGARVSVVQHRLEGHGLDLPASNEAGLKPTGDGGKDLHATGEHVVTVNLDIGREETFLCKIQMG